MIKKREVTVFIDVAQSQAGLVVGYKGTNIKDVQKRCGCRIWSPPPDAPPHEDGTVSFKMVGVAEACFEAYEMIQEDLPDDPIPFMVVRMQMERAADVGQLIGKRGAGIRALKEKFEVEIVTGPKEERGVSVVIEGPPKNVMEAHLYIAAIKKEEETYQSSRTVKDAL